MCYTPHHSWVNFYLMLRVSLLLSVESYSLVQWTIWWQHAVVHELADSRSLNQRFSCDAISRLQWVSCEYCKLCAYFSVLGFTEAVCYLELWSNLSFIFYTMHVVEIYASWKLEEEKLYRPIGYFEAFPEELQSNCVQVLLVKSNWDGGMGSG